MSSICTIIAPDACIGCREELVNLTKSVDNKRIIEIFNKNDVYIGLCSSKSKNDAESIIYKGTKYSYCFCGELYNSEILVEKIRSELGYSPIEEINDGIIATWCYILWGGFSPKMLQGKFAYSIYSEGIFKTSPQTPKLFIAKDRFGFIPIYYYQNQNGNIYLSNDIASILKIRGIKREISFRGLWQMLYLGGMTLPNMTVFDNIHQLRSGHCAYIDCRGRSNIMIKCYDNTQNYKLPSEITLDEIIRNSFLKRSLSINEKQSDFDLYEYDSDNIFTSIGISSMSILPSIYSYVSNIKNEGIRISSVGKELLFNQRFCMRGFFSWISDPYENIELIENKRLRICEGFDYLNEERLKVVDPESEKYGIDSLYRFYLPMILSCIEEVAGKVKVHIKYPYCDESIVTYLYCKNQLSDTTFKKDTGILNKTKNSEFDKHLIDSLQNAISNSESVLNYIANKEKLSHALNCGVIRKDLILLYSIHSMFEKFNLDLNIKP